MQLMILQVERTAEALSQIKASYPSEAADEASTASALPGSTSDPQPPHERGEQMTPWIATRSLSPSNAFALKHGPL